MINYNLLKLNYSDNKYVNESVLIPLSCKNEFFTDFYLSSQLKVSKVDKFTPCCFFSYFLSYFLFEAQYNS
jgi:hypothetical protein